MSQCQGDNINSIIRPLHIYSKLFGVTCFSLKRTSDGKLNSCITIIDASVALVYLWFNIFTWIMVVCFYADNVKNITSSTVFSSTIPVTICFTSCTLNSVVNVCASIIFRNKIVKAIRLMEQFDDKVNFLISGGF